MARMAWGAGLATIARDGSTLDTWYRWLGWGDFGGGDCPIDEIENSLTRRDTTDEARGVTIRPVRISIDVDDAPASPEDAYLRLHLLSHRLASRPERKKDVIGGTFRALANGILTNTQTEVLLASLNTLLLA